MLPKISQATTAKTRNHWKLILSQSRLRGHSEMILIVVVFFVDDYYGASPSIAREISYRC
jgi:hypothetical protein